VKSPEHQKRNVSEYVELEAPDEKVKRAEKISTEKHFGNTHDVWDVETDKDRYWVITEPTNLYSHSQFPSMDYALSFHIGLMSRMSASQNSNATDEDLYKTPKAWRQWEQTDESLQNAEEAEDFQAIGVRCREILVTFVDELKIGDLTNGLNSDVKKADIKTQLEILFDHLATGKSMRKIRAHMKTTVNSTWELVGWLTHHKNAIRKDAEFVLSATEHLMIITLDLLIRKETPLPERCPVCKSYRVVPNFRSELMKETSNPYVKLCEACGWEEKRK